MKKILLVITCLVLTLSLVGCSSNSAKGTVSKFCEAMKDLNTEEMSKYTIQAANLDLVKYNNQYLIRAFEIIKKNLKKLDYKVTDEKLIDETSYLSVDIDYVDITDAINYAFDELYNSSLNMPSGADENYLVDSFITAFDNYLENDSSKKAHDTVSFACKKVDGVWKIANYDSDRLVNIITCNLQQAFSNGYNSIKSKL